MFGFLKKLFWRDDSYVPPKPEVPPPVKAEEPQIPAANPNTIWAMVEERITKETKVTKPVAKKKPTPKAKKKTKKK